MSLADEEPDDIVLLDVVLDGALDDEAADEESVLPGVDEDVVLEPVVPVVPLAPIVDEDVLEPLAPIVLVSLAPFDLFSDDVLFVVLGVAPPLGEPLPPPVVSAVAGPDAVPGELAEFCATAAPPATVSAAAIATMCFMFIPGLLDCV
jgi:hypothetical protein